MTLYFAYGEPLRKNSPGDTQNHLDERATRGMARRGGIEVRFAWAYIVGPGSGMLTKALDPALQEYLQGRYIATFGTENADGSIHLTAVWYLFNDGHFFVATSSKSRKVHNAVARPKASLMVDARKPGAERGVTATGSVEVISGEQSAEINLRIHSRYMSLAAISDPQIGPVFASFDDVTLRLTPDSWIS